MQLVIMKMNVSMFIEDDKFKNEVRWRSMILEHCFRAVLDVLRILQQAIIQLAFWSGSLLEVECSLSICHIDKPPPHIIVFA